MHGHDRWSHREVSGMGDKSPKSTQKAQKQKAGAKAKSQPKAAPEAPKK